MISSRVLLAVGAMLTATFVVSGSTPASADPTGTTFGWTATNFQGDTTGTDVIPFGVSTPTSSGVTIDSMVTTSVATDFFGTPLTAGGLDFVDIWITSTDGGFLSSTISDPSSFAITGLNWGPGSPPAIAGGLIFLSWDIDGTFVDLDATAFGLPVVPHPIGGYPSVPVGFDDPLDFIPYDGFGFTTAGLLTTLGLPALEALSVNSFHIGFEVVHVPEPTSVMLLGTGLASVLLTRRRRNR